MSEEDIPIPASMVPFIDSKQIDSASKYHSFKFVSINYIVESTTFLKHKLPRIELMIDRYLMK